MITGEADVRVPKHRTISFVQFQPNLYLTNMSQFGDTFLSWAAEAFNLS